MKRWTSELLCVATLAVLSGLQATAFAQQPLDLPTAIRHALEHNRSLAQVALGVKGSELSVRGAEAAFDVSIKPDGSAGVSGSTTDWRYGLTAEKGIPFGTRLDVGGSASRTDVSGDGGTNFLTSAVRVELTQPLFRRFGSLINAEGVTAANDQLKGARRRWEEQKADLIIDVVRTFENLILLQKEIQSDQAFFERMEKLYALTQARERLGRSTRVDSLRVELQRGQAQARLENNRERLRVLYRDFADLLGMPLDTEFALQPPPLLDIPIPDPEQATRTALDNRMDYAQALQDHQTSRRQVRIARRGLYPDMNLTTRYRRFGESDTLAESVNLRDEDWFVGLSGDMDLNQSRPRIAVSVSELDAESARQAIKIKEISIAREVQESISNFRRTQTEMGIAERNYKLAQARAELARRMFQVGRGDNFAVTDAEDASVQAEALRLNARMDASVSGYELLRAMGILIEYPEELKPANAGAAP